jgi:erythromycin esterase-like protein/predicted phosphoribosyltransferase
VIHLVRSAARALGLPGMSVTTQRFANRGEAGRLLARRLRAYARRDDVIVLAVTRGGVPVAAEIAKALGAPLDVLLMRRLRVPGHEEVAVGVVASSGARVLDRGAMRELDLTLQAIETLAGETAREVERQARAYRGDRPPPELAGRTAILVDDAVMTGDRMRAAVRAVLLQEPERVVVAVPVAPRDACAGLEGIADEVLCLREPERLGSAASWYEGDAPPDERRVQALLAGARPAPPEGVAHAVRPLEQGYAELLQRAAAADFVLIGGASHGTHEFYAERAELTKRLIAEAGFIAVAVEADWPDARRVDRYVRRQSDDATAEEALSDFRRFPAWMWRNRVVRDFTAWLREHNDAHERKAGFYGLDLYGLRASMAAVVDYLEGVDPDAATRARGRYACFDHSGGDPRAYGYTTALAGTEPCEQEAVEVLIELRRRRAAEDTEDAFFAAQDAALVVGADEHYRALFRSGRDSWNLRDRHMANTLDALVAHLERDHRPVKVVLWAHNSHLGDARATEMGPRGELNLGELVRAGHGDDALVVGLTTYTGTITAASGWGLPAERRCMRPALPGSWEERFHQAGEPRALVDVRRLDGVRLERAIGVVYRPETERISHYFLARLAAQFDALLHIDETTALEPLERTGEWERGEAPATYPWGV